MVERPILYKGEMVKAILDDRKTQTRRLLKVQPIDVLPMVDPKDGWVGLMEKDPAKGEVFKCRYGTVGDELWVRETHCLLTKGVAYKADGVYTAAPGERWRPSIHMHRKNSRIQLEITEIRCQRLQDISHDDAKAEGCDYRLVDGPNGEDRTDTPVDSFCRLWDEINAKTPWNSNPYVWAITFRRVT